MHNTLIPCEDISELNPESQLKPDGLLRNIEEKTIFVLEFKRTSDFWPDCFSRGYLKKWVKYAPLVQAIQESNPGWKVELAIFVLGDRGLLDEEQWEDSWELLGLAPRLLQPFCIKAVLAAQTATTSCLAVYNTALQALNAAPGGAAGL
jgi:hypothetical protein